MEIDFPKRNRSVTAILLEDDAPRTCGTVWKSLEKPLESTVLHAIAAGRKVFWEIPPTREPDYLPFTG
jgi:hypothetical protein